MRSLLFGLLLLYPLGTGLGISGPEGGTPSPPNFILIFADDLGYGDLGCYGSELSTPNLDRMAREGMRLDSFYVAAAVCSPSRAALLTGSYPIRVGITKVLFPQDDIGLNPAELTIAELLRDRGYATACIGKWHLGHHPPFLPTRQGFDRFFGLPYSNDMHPPNAARRYPPLPLMQDEEVLETDPDQDLLTRRYTEAAIRFMEENRARPFFLYFPHTMPHRPLHASREFTRLYTAEQWKQVRPSNKLSRDFLFPAVIEELDWSTGQILQTLARLGLEERTLVLFTSDNGPAVGSAGPLRGRKGQAFEGGMRVPFLARWPGVIPAGATSAQMATSMDLLPTLAALAGAPLPKDRVLDGRDIGPILQGRAAARPPHDFFLYYRGRRLTAIRSGPWKLHVRTAAGDPAASLYHLGTDLGERRDVARDHPEVVRRLQALASRSRRELGDGDRHPGEQTRPAGKLRR